MTDVDLSPLPKGFLRWRTLITWLAGTDDAAERYFLEKKSQIRLDGKDGRAGRAKVAKFILAANRDPDKAARPFSMVTRSWCWGSGTTGMCPMCSVVEALDLEHDVQRFIGVDGPRWDFERISWSASCGVIVIVVDPPDGRVWACRADGPENLGDGEIYIRADGGTRAAKRNVKHAMFARLAQRATPRAKVSVSLTGGSMS